MSKSKPKATKAKKTPWRPSENQRWVVSFTLLFVSLFVMVSIISYYFTWRNDQMGGAVANNGGSVGYKIGDFLVGDWFGLLALGVPVVMAILSVRIMLGRISFWERSVRITTIVMILGAVTLGAIFGTNGALFGSGAGGKMGIDVAVWLRGYIGQWGVALLLFLSWTLLAVYLNRSTITKVNDVTRKAADLLTYRGHKEEELEDEEQDSCENSYYGADNSHSAPRAESEAEPSDEFSEVAEGEGSGESGVEFETIVGGDDDYFLEESQGEDDTPADTPFATSAQGVLPAEAVQTAGGVPDSGYNNSSDEFEEVDSTGTIVGVAVGVAGAATAGSTAVAGAASAEVAMRVGGDFEEVEIGYGGMDGLPANSEQKSPQPATIIGTGGMVESSEDGQMQVIRTQHEEAEVEKVGSLYDPTRELARYQRPPVEILEKHGDEGVQFSSEEINDNKDMIQKTLEAFGITIRKITATIGPTVTLYEIEPAMGMKVSRIKGLENDIAVSLKALSIRLIVPMPGRGTIGIEIPNRTRRIVSMYSVVRSAKFQESKYELPVVLGKTIQNETFVIDLAKMPHLLVAGATGQGKSVGLNVIINSLIYKKHPAELKFVMVDPKKVELSLYAKLEKHFLAKMESEDKAILTDTQKVVYTLNSLCNEMQARYDLLQKAEVKKISEYNQKFLARRLNPNKGHRFLPYIVVVIDEFADMIMTAGKEVETPIVRLGQLARAIGIHMIIATQRPDAKVITGLISANCPARIAFKVTNRINSQIILGGTGAEKLVGDGDMLMQINGVETRLQCAFIDTPEIERITNFVAAQRSYSSAYLLPDYVPEGGDDGGGAKEDMGDLDSMFEEIARFVVSNQQGSTSFVQRRFKIGYNRAGRIMDQLEQAGIVGRSEGSKPREVLINDLSSLERILNDLYIENL